MKFIDFIDKRRTRNVLRHDVKISNGKDCVRITLSPDATKKTHAAEGIKFVITEDSYMLGFRPVSEYEFKARPTNHSVASEFSNYTIEVNNQDDMKKLQKFIGKYWLQFDNESQLHFIDRRRGEN